MSQLEVDKIVPQSGTTLTIGDSGDTINFADGQNINIDSNTLYIDSTNNRVGIGTSSPDELLSLEKSNAPKIQYKDTSGGTDAKVWRTMGLDSDYRVETRSDNLSNGQLAYSVTRSGYVVNEHKFFTSDSERMRIDSSGNVMVGKTTSNYTSPGVEAKSNGNLIAVRDSGNVVNFIRNTNDGSILTFAKDTTNFGSIGVKDGNNLFIDGLASNHCGIEFDGGSYIPRRNSATADNLIDLGTSSTRFAHLYLGGGVFLGGTGSANELNDYEEGTWTPTIKISGATTGITYSVQSGHYTKIGNRVIANAEILLTNKGSNTGNVSMIGLPFTTSNDNYQTATVYNDRVSSPNGDVQAYIVTNSQNINFYQSRTDGTSNGNLTGSEMNNTSYLIMFMTYKTDA